MSLSLPPLETLLQSLDIEWWHHPNLLLVSATLPKRYQETMPDLTVRQIGRARSSTLPQKFHQLATNKLSFHLQNTSLTRLSSIEATQYLCNQLEIITRQIESEYPEFEDSEIKIVDWNIMYWYEKICSLWWKSKKLMVIATGFDDNQPSFDVITRPEVEPLGLAEILIKRVKEEIAIPGTELNLINYDQKNKLREEIDVEFRWGLQFLAARLELEDPAFKGVTVVVTDPATEVWYCDYLKSIGEDFRFVGNRTETCGFDNNAMRALVLVPRDN